MQPTKDEATRGVIESIEKAQSKKVSPAGKEWLRRWWDADGKDHVPRGELLAGEHGEALARQLTKRITAEGGPALFVLSELEGAEELSPMVLWAFSEVFGLSGTDLCNTDPRPS